MEVALMAWIWLALTVFMLGSVWRAWRYASAPPHLRWDLYPVAHEPGRDHGGSYLEQREWWTKPRKTSHLGSALFMAEEILLLAGVFKHNRKVWWGSFPFHWGLYLMIAATGGLVLTLVGGPWAWLLVLLGLVGATGGALLAAGALILLLLRLRDSRLKPYTTPVDLMNLGLLVLLGALSVAVAVDPPGMAGASAAMGDLAALRPPRVSFLLGLQMALASLFLLYLPMTRMVHFIAKYFTYHAVRWDDRPRVAGSALDRRLAAALDFGVSWSASHIQTGKTWAEVATTLPAEAGKED